MRIAIVLAAAALIGGCATAPRSWPVEVTRFHTDEVGRGTIAVVPDEGTSDGPEFRTYANAIGDALTARGYTVVQGAPSTYVARVSLKVDRRTIRGPAPFTLGQNAEMAIAHFKYIADATDLPLIAFQYPLAGGQGYPRDTLMRLLDAVPTIRAIKDWSNNVPQHERHIVELQSRPRPVTVLTTHSSWLFSSLVLGCNGLLSGAGSVIADLQSELFKAVKGNDLARARAVNERIRPLAQVFYADPFVDMHNRMKEALVLLGRIPRAVVRPPLVKLQRAEVARIAAALEAAGLLKAGASRAA